MMSVLNKKDDKLVAGNKKNVKLQHNARVLFLKSLLERIKINKEVTQYNPIGIDFNARKLFPKKSVATLINQANNGGLE